MKLIRPNKERLNPTSTLAETVEPFFIDKEKSREHFSHPRRAF
jgi:hypothetical protein